LVSDERQPVSTLRDYLDTVRRWWLVILVCAVLAPLVAVLMSRREPALYQASAQVLIKRQNLAFELQNVTDPTAFDATRTMETQAELARLPEIARRAVAAVGANEDASQLLGASNVSAQDNSDILTFSVRDRDPQLAARLATAYASQFTKYRNEIDNASITGALRSVEERIAALEAAGNRGSALYTTLVTTEEQLRTMQALQTSQAILVREAGGAGQIQPDPFRAGMLGAMLGIVLGFGFAFLAEALDTRIRSEERIRGALGLPLLGRLSKPPSKLAKKNRLVVLESRWGPNAEAFRMLATNLEFTTLESEAKTIMVTSALPREGKTTTLANLGIILARQGRRVTLIDLDLTSPQLHRFFDLEDGPGLTELALGHANLERTIVRLGVGESDVTDSHDQPSGEQAKLHTHPLLEASNGSNRRLRGGSLDLLRAGTLPPNSGDFVSFQAVTHILRRISEQSDVVLVDSPPLLLSGTAVAVTAQVDAILVISRLKLLRTRALNELKRVLDACPTRKLGFVVTGSEVMTQYDYGQVYAFSEPTAERSKPDFSTQSRTSGQG
jgi:Mrp family chromosome partitioning ATPase